MTSSRTGWLNPKYFKVETTRQPGALSRHFNVEEL
jgi:hypothetical protein